MTYAISAERNHRFSFEENDPSKKTPDAYLKEVPIEIKAILDDIQFQTKIESDLYSEVFGTLKRDKIIKDINDALIQSARIVVLNITPSSLEYALALYSSSNNVNLSIEDAISNSLQLIDMKISDIIPVVVIASCVDDHRKYRVSAVCLKCPVKMNNGPPSVDVHKIPPRARQSYPEAYGQISRHVN